MNTKGEALASKFEATINDFVSTVSALGDTDLQKKTPEEGWSVAATAHHAAISTSPLSEMVRSAATGSPMPSITTDQLNQGNAEHAKQFANASRDETLAVLRQVAGPVTEAVRGITDEQMARKATMPFGGEMTAEQIIENVLIGHLAGHGASIEAATKT